MGRIVAKRRLHSITVRDFRSISGEWNIPLDADVVLIHGQNGAGKTSLLSALELAATGRISYLDRIGDLDYLSHLRHWGTKSGQVRLETVGLPDRNLGTALATVSGAECDALLDGRMAEAFVERCFLAQATLGRLFEVYAPRGSKNADEPLMRFVKEVLGLDALDALIDGLYSAADIRRIEKQSVRWQTADRQTAELGRQHRDAVGTREAARARVDALTADLSARLDVPDGEVEPIYAAADALIGSRANRDAESALLRESQLRLDALESTLVQAELLGSDPKQIDDQASGVGAAESRYAEWKATTASPLEAWYILNHQEAKRESLEPATMLRSVRSDMDDAEAALATSRRQVQTIADLDDQLTAAGERLSQVELVLADLNEARARASTSSAAASLASLLVSTLEHADGDVCPVCDQPYHGAESLRGHIIAKADALNADAQRLLDLEARRATIDADRALLTSNLAELAAQRQQLAPLADLNAAIQRLAQQIGELRSLEPVAEAGLLLAFELDRARQAEVASIRNRALTDRCVADLNAVAAMLGAESPNGLLAQRVAALRAIARINLDEVESHERQIANVVRQMVEFVNAIEGLDQATAQVGSFEGALAAIKPHVDEAKRRKEIASRLRRGAETLRTATITRVFDERLNGSWARIFGALVPSEPFIPQFKRIPEGARRVTIDVETQHRDGTEAATPAAMLSQGNLNTAALSLFVALHFAVPGEMPWLIFDDPVQSMDDLHVSNFAAMVKQLTRRNGRQVVIAVHERELFDYLTLELTPGSPNEELLTVVLDRTYGESVISWSRVKYREDTALEPISAA
jgi:exonuclease SbcC